MVHVPHHRFRTRKSKKSFASTSCVRLVYQGWAAGPHWRRWSMWLRARSKATCRPVASGRGSARCAARSLSTRRRRRSEPRGFSARSGLRRPRSRRSGARSSKSATRRAAPRARSRTELASSRSRSRTELGGGGARRRTHGCRRCCRTAPGTARIPWRDSTSQRGCRRSSTSCARWPMRNWWNVSRRDSLGQLGLCLRVRVSVLGQICIWICMCVRRRFSRRFVRACQLSRSCKCPY